jgi:Lrp/AsnC family transcriptional regulator, leucine-responsive regulatory protein
MASRTERSLDATDWRILEELQTDGRLSYNELGRRVSLSPPAVAERVRRLEELGVITGCQEFLHANHSQGWSQPQRP